MPKTNRPSYRLHKATGQAFIELGGRRIYLGKHGSKASREKYDQLLGEYLANGRKLPPTRTKSGISCRELAVNFLEWAEGYYVKNGETTDTFGHYRRAMSLLVQHYGDESVNGSKVAHVASTSFLATTLRWAGKSSQTTISPFRNVGHNTSRTYSSKRALFIVPSKIAGAVMPPFRIAQT